METLEDIPKHILGYQSVCRPADWPRVWELARVLRQHKTDIVELYSPEAQLVGCIAARLSGVPSVLSCRRNLGYQYGRKALIQTKMTNWNIDRFVANSQAIVQNTHQLEGLVTNRFKVIYNGVDLQMFDHLAKETPHAQFEHAREGNQVVSVVANLRPVKNLSVFLKAAKIVATKRDDVVFAIIGTGSEENQLRKQSRELVIADRIIWVGGVPSPAPYLVRSNIGCLTSSSEGFSNAIVEYMAAGLPVVATNVGGAAEAIVPDKTGCLIESGDVEALGKSILDFVNNETKATSFGNAGRQRVEKLFSFRKQMEEYQLLYEGMKRRTR